VEEVHIKIKVDQVHASPVRPIKSPQQALPLLPNVVHVQVVLLPTWHQRAVPRHPPKHPKRRRGISQFVNPEKSLAPYQITQTYTNV
jgi:hypothetical protein